jgi:hypothetical protein
MIGVDQQIIVGQRGCKFADKATARALDTLFLETPTVSVTRAAPPAAIR